MVDQYFFIFPYMSLRESGAFASRPIAKHPVRKQSPLEEVRGDCFGRSFDCARRTLAPLRTEALAMTLSIQNPNPRLLLDHPYHRRVIEFAHARSIIC